MKGSMSIFWGRDKTEMTADRVGANCSGTVLCRTEKNPIPTEINFARRCKGTPVQEENPTLNEMLIVWKSIRRIFLRFRLPQRGSLMFFFPCT